jgi:anhydro-N-acetylmuramic acid kinase
MHGMAGVSAPITVIGLMSGTSMDGIDVALLVTDGERTLSRRAGLTYPYAAEARERLKAAVEAAWTLWGGGGRTGDEGLQALLKEAGEEVTRAHADAVRHFMAALSLSRDDVTLLGFHGQTVFHDASRGLTCQLGDGALLARLTGIDVVYDFRSDDLRAGGQGAPLVPVYHRALAELVSLERPLVVVNLGGIANVTWIGPKGDMLAFDVGPANALIDDWVRQETGEAFDRDGALARAGKVDASILAEFLAHPFSQAPPPKSLDREDLPRLQRGRLSVEDGAATLVAYAASVLAASRDHMPEPPRRWVLSGGGARNPALVAAIAGALSEPVVTAEEVGWSAEHLEAEAFAYLAVRALRRLPLTLPGTTGVPRPVTGGRFVRAPR